MGKLPAVLPCPFCGSRPFVGPADPEREGNAGGWVECRSGRCPAMPRVGDGSLVSDDRGSDKYKALAIRRWNRRPSQAKGRKAKRPCSTCGGPGLVRSGSRLVGDFGSEQAPVFVDCPKCSQAKGRAKKGTRT